MAERWKYILEFGEQRFGLEGQPASIGRSRKCEIAIADPSVSRRHAVLTAQEGLIHLEDLGSSNGTFVNGERVQGSVHLRNGDILALGDAEIRVYVIAAGGVETVRMPAGGVPPELADELPVGEATSFLQEASVKLARDALGESGDESMPSVPVRNHMAPPPPPVAGPPAAGPPPATAPSAGPPPAGTPPLTVEMPAAGPPAPHLDPENPLQTAQFDPSMLQGVTGGAAPESPLQTMHIDTGDLPKAPGEGAAAPRDLLQTARFDPESLPTAAPQDPHQTARFDPGMLPTAGPESPPQAPLANPPSELAAGSVAVPAADLHQTDPHQTDPHQTARFDPGMLPTAGPESASPAQPAGAGFEAAADPVDPRQTDPHQTARFDPSMLPTAGPESPPLEPVADLGSKHPPAADPHQTDPHQTDPHQTDPHQTDPHQTARFDPVAMGLTPPATEPQTAPTAESAPLGTRPPTAPASTEFVPQSAPEATPLVPESAPTVPEIAPVLPESTPPVADFAAPSPAASEVPLISPTGIGTEEADISSLEASASFASVAASLDAPGSQGPALDSPSFEPASSAVDPSSFAAPAFEPPAVEAQELPSFEAPASFDPPSFEAPSSFDPPSFDPSAAAEAPSFDPPAAEAPSFEAPPAFDPPSFDPPATEAPSFEAPSFEAPSSFDPPSFDPPAAEVPSFEAPSSFAPAAPSPSEPSAVEPPPAQAPASQPAAEEGFGFEAPFAGSSLGESFTDPPAASSGQRLAGNPPLEVPVPSSAVGDIRDLAASEGSDDLGFGGDMLSSLEGFDTTLGPDSKLPESMQRAQEQMAQLRQEDVGMEAPAPVNPYVPAGAANSLTSGSFVFRAVAFVVDAIWVGGLVFGFMGLSEPINAQLGPQMGRLAVTAIPVFISLLVVLVGWSVWGSTPGKRLCGLVVADAEGKPGIGFPRAVIRLVGYVVSTMLLGLGFLMALGASRRALHDVLAGSQVLKR